LSGPEKGCFFHVNMLIFLAEVHSQNVNEGQVVGGSKMLPPHELVQVARDHFLGRSIHLFESSFSPLPITLHAIGVGSCDGVHEISRFGMSCAYAGALGRVKRIPRVVPLNEL